MLILCFETDEITPWTTTTLKEPRQMFHAWDYIDQRGLPQYNTSRRIPRVKLTKLAFSHIEDESPLPNERSRAVTYFHNFPVYYLPYLRPETNEITIGNYFYVSKIFYFKTVLCTYYIRFSTT